MRILALNWRDIRSPEAGGSEVHLHELLSRLVRSGHDLTLVCSQFASGTGPAKERVDGVKVVRVGTWWNAHIAVPRCGSGLLKRNKFDLVLDDVNKIPFFAPAWSPIPVVAIFHHLLGSTVFKETNPLAAAAVWMYERRVGKVYRNTPCICVSQSTAMELRRRGVTGGRLHVVTNGIDHTLYRPSGVSSPPEKPVLLAVSRLRRYKGLHVAIRTSCEVRSRIPGTTLVILGSGPDRRRLEKLAARLKAPVQFRGYVSDREKVEWMSRARLLLAPSAKEGWGLSVMEAMACGTPVIASDVCGHRDSIPAGTGILVPHGHVSAMAAATLELLGDPAEYRDRRAASIAWARQFHWDRLAASFERIIDKEIDLVRHQASKPAVRGIA